MYTPQGCTSLPDNFICSSAVEEPFLSQEHPVISDMDEWSKAATGFQLGHLENQVPAAAVVKTKGFHGSMGRREGGSNNEAGGGSGGRHRWVPIPCERDNHAVVRVLDARPHNVAAGGRRGVAALSYQTLFPRSHPARSRRPTCGLLSPSPGGCVHRTGIRDGCLGDANGRPQSLTLQGQPELFSFGLWGCWPAKHMDRFGC